MVYAPLKTFLSQMHSKNRLLLHKPFIKFSLMLFFASSRNNRIHQCQPVKFPTWTNVLFDLSVSFHSCNQSALLLSFRYAEAKREKWCALNLLRGLPPAAKLATNFWLMKTICVETCRLLARWECWSNAMHRQIHCRCSWPSRFTTRSSVIASW